MYIYIYIYTHTCMYVCMYICIYIYIYIYIYTYTYTHTYIHTHIHVVYTCFNSLQGFKGVARGDRGRDPSKQGLFNFWMDTIYIYIYIYIHMYICMYMYMCVYIYIYILIQRYCAPIHSALNTSIPQFIGRLLLYSGGHGRPA